MRESPSGGPFPADPIGACRRGERRVFAAIVAASLFLLVGLERAAMHSKSEARTAVVAQEMLASGQWSIPTLHGELRLEKPPLYYWLICMVAQLTGGQVSDVDARLPSAISGVGVVLVVFLWARRLVVPGDSSQHRWFAPLASALVLSSPLFLITSRSSDIDVTLSLFTTLSGYLFWSAIVQGDRHSERGGHFTSCLAGYFFASLAVLTKGPIGLMVPLLPLWVVGLRRRPGRWHWKAHLAGWALMLVVALPWPLYILDVTGDRAGTTFWHEISMRFSESGKHAQPFYYYLGALVGMMPPMAVLLPWALRRWWKERRQPSDRYLFWTIIANLGLLLVMSSKRDRYLLPLLPACSLMVAWWLVNRPALRAAVARGLWAVLLVAGIAALLVSVMVPVYLLAPATVLIVLGVIAMNRHWGWQNCAHVALAWLALVYAGTLAYALEFEPRVAYYHGERSFAHHVLKKLPPDAQLLSYGEMDPVLLNYLEYSPLKVTDPKALLQECQDHYFLMADRDFELLDQNPSLVRVLTKLDDKGPGDEYVVYTVASGQQGGVSAALEPGPLRLVALGDMGTGHFPQIQLAQQILRVDEESALDGIILAGDLIYNMRWFRPYDLWRKFEYPYRPLIERGIPFYAALGNHEDDFARYLTRYPVFNMQGRRYYKHTLREDLCDLFVLDSEPFEEDRSPDELQRQREWLQQALATSGALWKIAVMHHPPYNFGKHHGHALKTREAIVPLLDEYGVQLVISGHEHIYQRIEPQSGERIYFVVGSGGEHKDSGFDPDASLKAINLSDEVFLYLELDAERLRFKAISRSGVLVDAGSFPLPSKSRQQMTQGIP